MDPDVAAIIRGLETRPGASEQALATLAASLDVSLPADYLKFLQMTDGAEGPIGEEGWVDLWPTEDILDMYRQGVINERRIPDVLEQWERPTHEWGDRTAWRLFNAATYALTGRIVESDVTPRLHKIIDGACTVH